MKRRDTKDLNREYLKRLQAYEKHLLSKTENKKLKT